MGKYVIVENRPNDEEFHRWLVSIQIAFTRGARNDFKHLFRTTLYGVDLYQTFLDELPEAERQFHDCAECRKFMNTYGTLVAIKDNGVLVSPFWVMESPYIPMFYANAVDAVRHRVVSAHVVEPFLTDKLIWGKPPANNPANELRRHFHIQLDERAGCVWRNQPTTIQQRILQAKHAMQAMNGDLPRYGDALLVRAQRLIGGRAEFMQTKARNNAETLRYFMTTLERVPAQRRKQRQSLIWRLMADQNFNYAPLRETLLDGLLTDLQQGASDDMARSRLLVRVNRLPQQRGAPVIADHDAARVYQPALRRRFARLHELQLLWQGQNFAPAADANPNVRNRYAPTIRRQTEEPLRMTFAQFRAQVLPEAARIEYLTSVARYCAFVAPVQRDAPPIYLWDDDPRCPYSWYVYGEDSEPMNWNLPPNTWVKVTGIALRPHMWHQPERYAQFTAGAAFILNGCIDNGNRRSGIFADELRPELQPIMGALREFSHNTPLLGYEQASACGVRFNANAQPMRLRVYYTATLNRRDITITGWDNPPEGAAA